MKTILKIQMTWALISSLILLALTSCGSRGGGGGGTTSPLSGPTIEAAEGGFLIDGQQKKLMGGTVIDFVDVYWKRGNPDTQEADAIQTGSAPDGYRSDEYLGLFSVKKDPLGGPDILTSRPAFDGLVELYGNTTPWTPTVEGADILSPSTNSQVNWKEWITIRFRGLNRGDTIFVVVRPVATTTYYPQKSPVTLARESGPERVLIGDVFIGAGPTDNIGESFELIVAVTSDRQVADQLISSGKTGGIPATQWPPSGVRTFAGVTVVRK